jgi:hypothetical protein
VLAQKLRCMCVAQGMKPDRAEFCRADKATIGRSKIVGQPEFAVGLGNHEPVVLIGGPSNRRSFFWSMRY